MRKYLILLILIVFFGCTKKLSIADFTDDFSSYESELRIEAVLDPVDFLNSVVRVDKTLLVTDTSIFNGLDDNDDWISYTDDNGNGMWDEGEPLNDDIGVSTFGAGIEGRGNGKPDKGEPHVDDYTEILPHINDSTMTSVRLLEKVSGNLIAEFEWQKRVGRIEEFSRRDRFDSENVVEIFFYGGYKPKSEYANIQIEYGKDYEFEITTSNNNIITGSTIPFPPPELVLENTVWDADTLVLDQGGIGLVHLLTDAAVSFGNITFRNVFGPDSLQISHSMYFPPVESEQPGYSLYSIAKNMFPLGLSLVEVAAFDENYGRYFISALPLRDEALTNLRNQNGVAVLGIAGSASKTSIYARNSY